MEILENSHSFCHHKVRVSSSSFYPEMIPVFYSGLKTWWIYHHLCKTEISIFHFKIRSCCNYRFPDTISVANVLKFQIFLIPFVSIVLGYIIFCVFHRVSFLFLEVDSCSIVAPFCYLIQYVFQLCAVHMILFVCFLRLVKIS